MYVETDDIRQIFVVTKNEMIKSVRGRKFMASLILILLVFALITVVPFVTGSGWGGKSVADILQSYLSYVSTFAVLVVGLIGSVAIVSEYEERTALILFTRPIKRTSIFVGKFISSLLLATALVLVYYIGIVAMLLIYHGTVPDHLIQSFCMCFMYLFAAIGIAFVFSSVLKRSSVCIIFSILTLLVVLPVISTMITGDTWFMLDTAGKSIITCVPEYVDSYNGGINYMLSGMQTVYDSLMATGEVELAMMVQKILAAMSEFMTPIAYPTLWKEALVMFTWGAVALIVAWVAFLRREF